MMTGEDALLAMVIALGFASIAGMFYAALRCGGYLIGDGEDHEE